MRKLLLLLICAAAAARGHAQVNQINITDLYTPNAPGFVLADVAPSSVEKPSTPRAFGVSLLNLTQGGAMEVTPFWLTNHPKLTFDKYIQKKTPILETFNISVATFKTDTINNVSAGFRTHLFRAYTSDKKKALLNIKNQIVNALAVDPTNLDTTAIGKLKQNLTDERKRGFFLIELAGALLAASPTNSYNNLATSRSGLWLNARFVPDISSLDFIAVARYSWTNNTPVKGTDSSFFDYGLALNYAVNKFDCQAEFIARRDFSIDKNYSRFGLVANYMLTDNVVIVASVGKNFTPNQTGNILTVFGAKFMLSNQRLSLF